jgi:hypothetical protein
MYFLSFLLVNLKPRAMFIIIITFIKPLSLVNQIILKNFFFIIPFGLISPTLFGFSDFPFA